MTEPVRAELQVVKCAGRMGELDSAIVGAWRIGHLICRLLLAGFCLGLPRCLFGFSMNSSGALFRFLADCFSGFLGLSADSFGGLLRFFCNCFSGFLGFLARSFNSVFNRLSCFFRSVLHLFYCPFLPERNKRCGREQSNDKARYLHDCLLFVYCPCTKKTDEAPPMRASCRV
jgi:hypothetical protein